MYVCMPACPRGVYMLGVVQRCASFVIHSLVRGRGIFVEPRVSQGDNSVSVTSTESLRREHSWGILVHSSGAVWCSGRETRRVLRQQEDATMVTASDGQAASIGRTFKLIDWLIDWLIDFPHLSPTAAIQLVVSG